MEQSIPPSYGAPPTPPPYQPPPQGAVAPRKEKPNKLIIVMTILIAIALIIGLVALTLAIDTSRPVDTDNDGYANEVDRFPHDPSEWNDTDMDGVGDNTDAFPTNCSSSVRLVLVDSAWNQNPDTGGETLVYVPPDADYLTWMYDAAEPIEFTITNTYNEMQYSHYYTSSGSHTVYIGDPSGDPAEAGLKSGLWKIEYVNSHHNAVRIEMELILVI
jgi:hypothetical protein